MIMALGSIYGQITFVRLRSGQILASIAHDSLLQGWLAIIYCKWLDIVEIMCCVLPAWDEYNVLLCV